MPGSPNEKNSKKFNRLGKKNFEKKKNFFAIEKIFFADFLMLGFLGILTLSIFIYGIIIIYEIYQILPLYERKNGTSGTSIDILIQNSPENYGEVYENYPANFYDPL